MDENAELEKALFEEADQAILSTEPVWVMVDGSSNVAAYAWLETEPGTGTLHVRFHNGGEYRYLGVSESIWRAILSARSAGKAHWHLVRAQDYVCVTVTKPREDWRRAR